DVRLMDTQQDTLLAFDQLSASIGVFSLFQQTIQLDQIEVDGLQAAIYNGSDSPAFNYQFIIDAFAGDTTQTNSGGAVWEVGFGEAQFNQTRFRYHDSLSQLYLNTSIPELQLGFEQFDLAGQQVIIDLLRLQQPVVSVLTYSDTTAIDKVDSQETPLVFPDPGWTVGANDAIIEGGQVRYWVDGTPIRNEVFDANHLQFSELGLAIENFHWDSTLLELDLSTLEFVERSGLSLREASAAVRLSPNEIQVNDLMIVSPTSKIVNQSKLQFDGWQALPDFLNQVQYDIIFDNSQLSISDLERFGALLPEDYKVKEPLFLDGAVYGQNGNVELRQVDVELGNMLIFKATGQLKNISKPEELSMRLQLNELALDYRETRQQLPALGLPPNADSLGRINISGQINGSLDTLLVRDFNLRTSTKTFLKTSGRVNHLTEVDQLSFRLNIDALQTEASDLALFSTTPLPDGLYEMGQINYSGLLAGTTTQFTTEGKLSTNIGNLKTDLGIDFTPDYSDARYDGNVLLSNFNLGQFLGDTTLYGMANLEASVDGSGLSPDSLNTQLDATVQSIGYNGYQYQNIDVEGAVEAMKFTGTSSMKDPNLSFDFSGLVDLNDSIPEFQFQATLDTIDLMALKLMDQPLRTSAMISTNFSGNNIDNFLGSARIQQLYLSNDTLSFYS
ncbi:MAG: hypothetical protein AAFO94_12385, partial [Bacteroidota bacterium]